MSTPFAKKIPGYRSISGAGYGFETASLKHLHSVLFFITPASLANKGFQRIMLFILGNVFRSFCVCGHSGTAS
jgi:hypothetical protein